METREAIIGGRRLPGTGEPFEDLDPSTGQLLALVARCGPPEIDLAVAAASEAFERVWRHTDAATRARWCRRIADAIRANIEPLARLECADTGKPLSLARVDAGVAARYFEFYAGTIEALHGSVVQSASSLLAYTLLEPHGVSAHIIPWNYPLQVACRTLAPALATGNCCVLKPAEDAPLTSLRLGEILAEIGLPAGVLNVVPGLGHEAGAALAAHPNIDHLSFTGSREVGQSVMKAAAENVVPVTLELGGKSPHLVFSDADLDLATPCIVRSIIESAGQNCSAGSRLLVHEDCHDILVAALVADFQGLSIGPGADDPDLGPVINKSQRERVLRFCDIGRTEARLLVGGEAATAPGLERGNFVMPTIFDAAPPDAVISQEEIFGPVLSITTFSDETHALELANRTTYGLSAGIWTRDGGRANWLARELRVGQVFINNYHAAGGVELPFGGYKRSGFGREKGFAALLEYTKSKTVAVAGWGGP